MFAEMLVDIQGYGDPDEIAQQRLVDIIYEIKKAELAKEKPKEPDPEPEKPEEPEKPRIKPIGFWGRLTHDSDVDE